MKNNTILAVVCWLLLASCNEVKTDDKSEKSTEATPAEGTNGYAKLLVNLSGEKKLNVLLAQSWEMEDDLDVLISNNEPEGKYPFRSFYLNEDGSFVKNARNFLEYGRWSFDESQKKITLNPEMALRLPINWQH